MPQIIFELSDNVIERDCSQAITEIHQELTNILPTQLESCKSRVIRHKDFLIGDGGSDYAFIHLWISVLSGRSKETLDKAASAVTAILQKHFKKSIDAMNLKISVAISELPEVYHRV